MPTRPNREFCISLLLAKIDDILGQHRNDADHENADVSTARLRATTRESLRRLVPRVLPTSLNPLVEAALYRFVLDHGDFGMHNMTVAVGGDGSPRITSVYDWEGGSVVPAILSEPKMVVTVDLVIDEEGEPSISRWGDGDNPEKMTQYCTWAAEYYKVSPSTPSQVYMSEISQMADVAFFPYSVYSRRHPSTSTSSRLASMLGAFGLLYKGCPMAALILILLSWVFGQRNEMPNWIRTCWSRWVF